MKEKCVNRDASGRAKMTKPGEDPSQRKRGFCEVWATGYDEDDGFFYRLDWLNEFSGISLRFYKEGKIRADLNRMENVANELLRPI
jgi:hypothetical protein